MTAVPQLHEGRVPYITPPLPPPQHWSSAITATSPLDPWPVGRSFHTACCLVDPAYVPLPESKGLFYPTIQCTSS